VNLEIHPGEFWFFLGQNGSGKTTLMRAVLGLIEPQAGQLQLQVPVGSREQIGFVPQRCDINPTLPITVREFVSLGLVGVSIGHKEQREQLVRVLEKLGLQETADKNYWALSGGQRQRALLARALVRRPTLLILDEPTNNLDLRMEEAFLHSLADLQKEDEHTVLFVTHNLSIAERYATHIGFVTDGTVIAGPRNTILTEPNLDRVYGRGQHIHVHVTPGVSSASHTPNPPPEDAP
jgi:ABC-type Mn2+/Zn2+ transport system ATPase subunit